MKNKKLTGIIVAVIAVLVIGLIGGTGDSNSTVPATELSENTYDTGYSYENNSAEYNQSAAASDDESTASESFAVQDKTTVEDKSAVAQNSSKPQQSTGNYKVSLSSIPVFSGNAYVSVNGNIPGLSAADRTSEYFEKYTALDYLDRCGVAFACLGRETMPTEERGAIGSVKPSGWHTVKYDCVDGKYLYNRCHLIGFQLSGENANTRNLITGTRYMNIEGMLPFENMVADYIKETGNHVLYRVTPVFKGSELVCRGVQIEAFSVEDNGDGICFNVYCYNNQPGVEIDYATGSSWLSEAEATTKNKETLNQKAATTTKKQETTAEAVVTENIVSEDKAETMVWIPNSGKRYHCDSSCSGMKNPTEVTLQEAKELGYTACGRCY